MSITELLPTLHNLSLEEKLQAMRVLCADVEQVFVNRDELSGDREVLVETYDRFRDNLKLYQQRTDEFMVSEARTSANAHGLSLRELVRLPLADRHRLLSPFVAGMAEDFASDPELTEFAVLDGEDWEKLDENS